MPDDAPVPQRSRRPARATPSVRITRTRTGALTTFAVVVATLGLAVAILATRPPRGSRPTGTLLSPPPMPASIAPSLSIAGPRAERVAPRPDASPEPALAVVDGMAPRPRTFVGRREARPTHLRTVGPVPLPGESAPTPPGVEQVTYASDALRLRAWFALPSPRLGPVPVVVFLHRGLALDAADWTSARPFLEAGFALLLPTFRGEAGNPGAFELLYGEADDVRAACRFAAAREEVDPQRVYVFGNDLGGALAGLVSLYDEPPVALTGSVGGLWTEFVFDEWQDQAPFDPLDPHERAVRLLATNLDVMRRPHVAFVGQQDDEVMEDVPLVMRRAARAQAPLELFVVPGNHRTGVAPAVREFLARIMRPDH